MRKRNEKGLKTKDVLNVLCIIKITGRHLDLFQNEYKLVMAAGALFTHVAVKGESCQHAKQRKRRGSQQGTFH